jgi:hypothetical protein
MKWLRDLNDMRKTRIKVVRIYGDWGWVLLAGNNKLITYSAGTYDTPSAALRAARTFRRIMYVDGVIPIIEGEK